MRIRAERLLKYTRKKVETVQSKEKYRTAPEHFTRKSKMNFKNTTLIVLNMVKKSIKVELMDYFEKVEENTKTPSRNAFTLAREKISYRLFKDLFDKSCELAAEEEGSKQYKGYRIFAIDGTSFMVGKLSELSEYFGNSTTVAGKAMCRINSVVDVINNCIVNSAVSPFSVGERSLAINQVNELVSIHKALYLFDRGYWSPELTACIIKNGQKFVMRLASYIKNAVAKDDDGIPYDLRRYSFVLSNGETQTLITNLTEEEMSDDELAALYTKRWGIETKYLELKDRLQLDKFSGSTANIVLQDIFSTMYISNLAAFICGGADDLIADKTDGKDYKHPQKANRTICIAALRRRFIKLCLIDDPLEQSDRLQFLVDEISKCVTYTRKSKPKPRDKKKLDNSRHSCVKTLL